MYENRSDSISPLFKSPCAKTSLTVTLLWALWITTQACSPKQQGTPVDFGVLSPAKTYDSTNDANQLPRDASLSKSDAQGLGSKFVGMWGLLINAAAKQTDIPVLQSQITVARHWYLVELTANGDGTLKSKEKLCNLNIRLETWLNQVIVPQKFVDSTKTLERHITIQSEAPGSSWKSDDVYEIRGAKLLDVQHDPLPPSGSAKPGQATPCDQAAYGTACDQDSDGNPGMTNYLKGVLNCKVFVSQRWHSQLNGTIIDDHTIGGPLADAFSEQTVVATDKILCKGNFESVPVIDKCPKLFYFKMARLPNSATCKDVMNQTSCDENRENCEGDLSLALNPEKDDIEACK